MIKIYRRGEETGTNHECATVAEAHALFDAETAIIVARCSSDEECWDLVGAVLRKSRLAAEKGILDTVMIWTATTRQVDGEGWRLIFEQQEALTAKGVAKQQAAQAQAQAQAMAMMRGGGVQLPGGNGARRR
ncbi:MAG TPA: hypothetical protein VNV25_25745 [Gemmatimonadaceae bacterium]|jgi:hypothetical protein|nr:hypothetical protein [Gemmatimonadaceae bacterium]